MPSSRLLTFVIGHIGLESQSKRGIANQACNPFARSSNACSNPLSPSVDCPVVRTRVYTITFPRGAKYLLFDTPALGPGLRTTEEESGCFLTSSSPWQVCCAKVDLHGFELPDETTPFRMVPLECCVENGQTVPGELVSPCMKCGLESIMPEREECPCFSEAVLTEPVEWLKRQTTLEGKKHDQIEEQLRPYSGTLGELVEEVRADYKGYLFHRYLVRFIRRQFHLDAAYFDGNTEAVVWADFASSMNMGGCAGY